MQVDIPEIANTFSHATYQSTRESKARQVADIINGNPVIQNGRTPNLSQRTDNSNQLRQDTLRELNEAIPLLIESRARYLQQHNDSANPWTDQLNFPVILPQSPINRRPDSFKLDA